MNAVQLLSRQPWVEHLGWTLLHFLWQGAAIAILFGTARALWGRSLTSQSRYLMACLALAAMVAAPLVTFSLTASARPATIAVGVVTGEALPLVPSGANSMATTLWRDAFPWMVLAWLTGALAFSVRLAGGWMFATRLRTVAVRPAPWEWQMALDRLIACLGMTQTVHLLVSSLVQVPTVVGWLRPVVLVPVGALAGLPADHVEALLAHELAHILRRDYLANLLQSVAEALLFYHPAVWWVSQQIRLERELCCDDLAVTASGDVLTYARALAELESCRPVRARAVLAANGGSLPGRIGRLLGQSHSAIHVGPRPGAALAAGLVLLAAAGAMAVRGDQTIERVPDQHGVTVDTSGSQLIHRTPVPYPEAAIEKRVEGTVVVEVTLDSQGDVADARITSGPDELRKSVLQSVLHWHFAPSAGDRYRQVRINFQAAAAQAQAIDGQTGFEEAQRKFEEARLAGVEKELERARAQVDAASRLGNHYRQSTEQSAAEEEALRSQLLGLQGLLGVQQQDQLAYLARLDMERTQRSSPSMDALQQQLRELAEQKQAAAQDMANQSGDQQRQVAEAEEQLAKQALQMDEARIKAELNLELARQSFSNDRLAGHFLDGIEFRGMPDEAANTLFAKIPVHRGAVLSAENIEWIRRAVYEFDPHLAMTISPAENNGVVIRIGPSGNRNAPYPEPK